MAATVIAMRCSAGLLLLAAASSGCAPMVEVRTETVLSSKKVRVSERREPSRDLSEVDAYLDSGRVIARTRVQQTCMVREAETEQVREHIERKKDLWAVGTEVTLAVIGAGILGMGIYGVNKDCTGGGACHWLWPTGVGVGGALALGAGTAAIVDISKGSVVDRTRTDTRPATAEIEAPCSGSQRLRHKLAIQFPTGAASAETDDSGIAAIVIPPGNQVSADGVLEVEIKLDDAPARRVRLRSERKAGF
jgi:hypothetical protein